MGDQCRKTETYFHHVSEMDGESTCVCAFCTAISLRVEFTCCLSVYISEGGWEACIQDTCYGSVFSHSYNID